MAKIEEASFEEIKGKNIDILITLEDLKEILEKIGYKIDETGVVLDENGRLVKGVNGEEINIKRDKELTLVAGSHIFARNIAELSEVLVKKDILKFHIK